LLRLSRNEESISKCMIHGAMILKATTYIIIPMDTTKLKSEGGQHATKGGSTMKIAEMLIQNGEKHDGALHMKAGPVNIRLYKSNKAYKELITNVIDYMLMGSNFDFEDYPKAQGISGANIGIPLNIVVVITKIRPYVFLNPTIVRESSDTITAKSNCGSLNLDESITVARRRWVWVTYYDVAAARKTRKFEIKDAGVIPSATLQHEIDHNLGILITEREVP